MITARPLFLALLCGLLMTPLTAADAPADAPEAAAPKADGDAAAAAPAGPKTISGAATIADLRTRFGNAVAVQGKGSFRFITVGDVTIPKADDLLGLADQVIKGMELWTGRQDLFTPPADEDGLCYFIIFKNKGDFDGFVDFLRKERGLKKPDGEDLTKKLNSLWVPRGFGTVAEKFLPIAEHFTVNLATGILIKTYFQQRGEILAPPWLAEGMRSEMEILLTKAKTPRITTIAYEMNDNKDPPPNNWLQAMSQLVAKPTDQLKKASDVMLIELIQSSRADYIQMWSLNLFLRQAGAGNGDKNKFAKLLEAIASGSSSRDAVTAVYGLDEPQLTRTWLQWAGRGKR